VVGLAALVAWQHGPAWLQRADPILRHDDPEMRAASVPVDLELTLELIDEAQHDLHADACVLAEVEALGQPRAVIIHLQHEMRRTGVQSDTHHALTSGNACLMLFVTNSVTTSASVVPRS